MTGTLRKRQAAFSETAIDDEIVVMALDSGDFFSLTGSAARIWRLLDTDPERDLLLSALSAEYGVPAGAIEADVDAFLGEMIAAGLLEG